MKEERVVLTSCHFGTIHLVSAKGHSHRISVSSSVEFLGWWGTAAGCSACDTKAINFSQRPNIVRFQVIPEYRVRWPDLL